MEACEAAQTVPAGESPIHWRLLTTHQVEHFEQACPILYWYWLRWYIETLFRVLKTQGFGVEATPLEEGQALVKMTLLALWAGLRVMILLLAASSISVVDQPCHKLFSPQQRACLEASLPRLEGQTAKLSPILLTACDGSTGLWLPWADGKATLHNAHQEASPSQRD